MTSIIDKQGRRGGVSSEAREAAGKEGWQRNEWGRDTRQKQGLRYVVIFFYGSVDERCQKSRRAIFDVQRFKLLTDIQVRQNTSLGDCCPPSTPHTLASSHANFFFNLASTNPS